MGENNPTNAGRRRVLKAISAGTIATSGFAVPGSARRGSRLEGFAYDPTTHEILGNASAQFNETQDELVGNLKVNGRKYNMNQRRKSSETNGKLKTQRFRETKEVEDERYNELVEVRVTDKANITGFVRSPESLDRTAFVLADSNKNKQKSNSVTAHSASNRSRRDSLLDTLERTGGEK